MEKRGCFRSLLRSVTQWAMGVTRGSVYVLRIQSVRVRARRPSETLCSWGSDQNRVRALVWDFEDSVDLYYLRTSKQKCVHMIS